MKRKKVMKVFAEGMVAQGIKIAGLEDVVSVQSITCDAFRQRLAEHDEAIEALADANSSAASMTQIKLAGLERANQLVFPLRGQVETHEKQIRGLWDDRTTLFSAKLEIEKRLAAFEKAKQDDIFPACEVLQSHSETIKDLENQINAMEIVIGEIHRTNDAARDASNRQAVQIMALTNENLKLRDQIKGLNNRVVTIYDRLLMFEEIYKTHNHHNQKTNLVMEKKRPVGRSRKEQ